MTFSIEISQLKKNFGKQSVIDIADLRIAQASIHAVVGPNSAGKTTLLKILGSVISPTTGTVRYFGEQVRNPAELRQCVRYVGPEINLYPLFKVKDILRYANLLYEEWDQERCKILTKAFAIPRDIVIRKLSLGMKMRLQIILALSSKPTVLLMDEATNGLDPATKEMVLDLVLREVANREITVVMATHQFEDVERVADTISLLIDGKVRETANLDDLKEQVYEVSAIFGDERYSDLRPVTGVHKFDKNGKTVRFVCIGDRADIANKFSQMGAGSIDVRPGSLQLWFRAMLEKEGVTNEKIVLS